MGGLETSENWRLGRDPRRRPDSILDVNHFFLSTSYPLLSHCLGRGKQSRLASCLLPSRHTQLTWGSLSIQQPGPTAECLLESSLATRRDKRQEVRHRLGPQLQQPRALFPPPAWASRAEEAQAGKPELPWAEAHEAPHPAPSYLVLRAPAPQVFMWHHPYTVGSLHFMQPHI